MATTATRLQVQHAQGRRKFNPVLGNAIPIANTHTQNSSLSSAVTISATDDSTTHIMLQNSDATVSVRYTVDGTAPTSSLGFLLEAGWYVIVGIEGVTLRVIETAASGQVDYVELIL